MLQGRDWSLKGLKDLLSFGPDVSFRDRHGRSCLHLALMGSSRAPLNHIQEALACLINSGADIFAVDDAGISVSTLACNPSFLYEVPSELELVFVNTKLLVDNQALDLRNVWKGALQESGLPAQEVIASSVDKKRLTQDIAYTYFYALDPMAKWEANENEAKEGTDLNEMELDDTADERDVFSDTGEIVSIKKRSLLSDLQSVKLEAANMELDRWLEDTDLAPGAPKSQAEDDTVEMAKRVKSDSLVEGCRHRVEELKTNRDWKSKDGMAK